MLIAFHKPYGVLSQFTPDGSANRTLAGFGFPKNVYPIGRLDADSEGLLLLSDEPEWNERLLHPRHAHKREYWVQVERIPTPKALKKMERGDQHVRMITADDPKGEAAFELLQRLPHRQQQVLFVKRSD